MTPNPLARRRRLGRALIELRRDRGHSHAELAAKAGVSASVISRLENPFAELNRRPNPRSVRKVLDALGLPRDSDQFREIERHAEIAADDGWWDLAPYQRMGAGQRGAALAEAGASRIDEYSGLVLPGLVQTAEFARRLAFGDPATDAIVAGRMERQRRLDGVKYQLILEEQAYRRWPVPADVMRGQLEHLLALAERPNVSIRIVPADARLGDGYGPRAPYAHISYPDPADPPIIVVDYATEIRLVTDDAEVSGYAQLYQRLCGAAVSKEETAALIREVAHSLAA